jgi:RNA polymerase sigma-70 factor (ECF subfamily)
MARFLRGERQAFAVLVRRHQSALFNFALRQLRSPTLAEEVVQETFLRVTQSAADFNQAARFTSWMYTIARNLCVDTIRRQALRRHPSLDEPRGTDDGGGSNGPTLGERTADPAANVEGAVVAGEIRARVLRALGELPDDQREVFLLREVSNLPFKEIAFIVGAPENTVKSRMRYALERMQLALSELEEYARALR